MPSPRVARSITTRLGAVAPRVDRDRAAARREYFAALLSRLPRICASRTGSRVEPRAARPAARRRGGGRRRGSAARWSRPRCARRRRARRAPCAARRCRGVMRDTSSRSSTSRTRWLTWRSMISCTRPARSRRCSREPAAMSQRVAQRRERVAQLVRERGEELVLAAVGLAQRLARHARLARCRGSSTPRRAGSPGSGMRLICHS